MYVSWIDGLTISFLFLRCSCMACLYYTAGRPGGTSYATQCVPLHLIMLLWTKWNGHIANSVDRNRGGESGCTYQLSLFDIDKYTPSCTYMGNTLQGLVCLYVREDERRSMPTFLCSPPHCRFDVGCRRRRSRQSTSKFKIYRHRPRNVVRSWMKHMCVFIHRNISRLYSQ